MVEGRLYGEVVRQGRLNENFTSQFPPPCTARHLTQELERSLTGSKIGKMDPHVGVDHSYEGHPGKIQPFGNHLSPQEDIQLPPSKTPQNLMVGPLP